MSNKRHEFRTPEEFGARLNKFLDDNKENKSNFIRKAVEEAMREHELYQSMRKAHDNAMENAIERMNK